MKKIIVAALTVILLLPLFSFGSTAANPMRIVASCTQSIAGGSIFAVTIGISGNTGIASLEISISYPGEFVELTEISDTGMLAGYTSPSDMTSDPLHVSWSADDNSYKNGAILNLKLKTKAKGNIMLSVSASAKDRYGSDVEIQNSSNTIAITCDHSGKKVHHPAVAANCVNKGNIEYWTCSICNMNFTDEACTNQAYTIETAIDKTNHKVKNHVSKIEPTCKELGREAGIYCDACNTAISGCAEIPTTDNHTRSSCTKIDGTNHKYACKVCGKEVTESHSWDAGTITKQPNCEVKGVKTYKCIYCDATKTEEIGTISTHSFGDWESKDTKNHIRTCNDCNTTETEEHTFDEGKTTKVASCKEEGVTTYTCTVCGYTKTKPIPTTDVHHFDLGVITVEPTEVKEGVKTYTCINCGLTKTETVPVKLHKHTYDGGKVTLEPTCKETGVLTYTCTSCGGTKNEEIAKSKQHRFTDGSVTKKATCKEKGETLYTCIVCGETKTEEIPETDHNFGKWIKGDDGNSSRTCRVCGATESVKGEPPKEETKKTDDKSNPDSTDKTGETVKSGDETTVTEKAETKISNDALGINGITVTCNGEFPDGTVFSVREVDLDSLGNIKLGDSYKLYKVYDLSITDIDKVISTVGKLTVRLPLSDELASEKHLTVVSISSDGKAVNMNANRIGKNLIFETDTMSYFGIAKKDKTTELIIFILIVVVLTAVIIVAAIGFHKHKKNNPSKK